MVKEDEAPILKFKGVTARWAGDDKPVFRNLSLKFSGNENVAVVGRVGSGKSSFLLAILNENDSLLAVGWVPQTNIRLPQDQWKRGE